MFVRFRQTKHRLQVSLVEPRRSDGRVRQEHVASFGSIDVSPSVEARLAFWRWLHERLAKLSNRVDAAVQAKILADIHARIPMVTLDEQHRLKIENAEANERFWTKLHAMHEEQVTGHKDLLATAERSIAAISVHMAQAVARAAEARERIERIRKGEDVPVSKPLTRENAERILREAGFTTADIRHMDLVAAFADEVGEDGFEEYLREFCKRAEDQRRAHSRAAMRAVLRKRGYAV
jgi:hypothetical protein